MKKVLILAAALLAGLSIMLVALPMLISSDAVRNSLIDRAREITGREMKFSGDPTVSFYPFLGIEIQNVTFGSENASPDGQPILSMPKLKGKLSITSALRGRIEVDEFQFVRPKFSLTLYPSGSTNWAFPDGKIWQTLKDATQLRLDSPTNAAPDISKLGNAPLGRFKVEDGIIEYRNEVTKTEESITNFNGTLVWPNVRSGWEFNGRGNWRGDTVAIVHSAKTPIFLLAGGTSSITGDIRSQTLNLSFVGEANRLSDFFLKGKVQANSPSLRNLIGFFGGSTGVGASFSNFNASGDFAGTIEAMQLENAKLELDGNALNGSLRLAIGAEVPNRISGTLAANSIDLSSYFPSGARRENATSIFEILRQADLDLRISASKFKIDTLELSDFAGGLIAKDSNLKIDIGNAGFNNAIIVGSLDVAKNDEKLSVTTNLNASGINPAKIKFLENVSGVKPQGLSNIKISLKSESGETGDFFNDTNGTFSLTMKKGQLDGLDFSDIRPVPGKEGEPKENIQIGNSLAKSEVTNFNLNVAIISGVGWVENSGFDIEEFSTGLSGKADLRSGNLAVWGELKKKDDNTAAGTQFFLGGTLSLPLYVPDIRSRLPSEPEKSNASGLN